MLQIQGILAKRKDLIARNQETERPGACCAYPVATDYRRNDEFGGHMFWLGHPQLGPRAYRPIERKRPLLEAVGVRAIRCR